jgi:asparagine synthetase B (glutamine-hydrolysing)
MLDGEILAIDGRATAERGTSDGELAAVAALHRRLGPMLWSRLDGSFCLIIHEPGVTRIGFDVGGTRALYWWAAAGVVAFHTRLLDLAPGYPGRLDVDPAGLATYLSHAIYPNDRTAFDGIRLIGAGQYLEIDRTGREPVATACEHFRYVPTPERTGRSITDLADQLNELVAPAIERTWHAARNPVLPLSGGVDSRYLAAAFARASGDPSKIPAITWGEDPLRPGSDATIAPRVAAALGIPHTWYAKAQRHDRPSLEETLYLTSGEGDSGLHYPGNHDFHRQLAADRGFESLLRGDQLFGASHRLRTDRAVFAAAGLSRIRHDPIAAQLVGGELHRRMADAQDAMLEAWRGSLQAPTPQTRLYELKFATTWRRELVTYSSLKHAVFETYTPLIQREILDWVRRLPDEYRVEKRVFKLALARRFPELATIPFATRSNLPDWDQRARSDPELTSFLLEWCTHPGWLHEIGAAERVQAALATLAHEAAARGRQPGQPAAPTRSAGARREAERRLRDMARATLPGSLFREWTMERRAVRDRSLYSRLSRLAMLHWLVAGAKRRHDPGRHASDA